jgi:hypothetical protein
MPDGGTGSLSPVVGYTNDTVFVITIYSENFDVADSIVSVQPYDADGNPLTAWTINDGQYQDTTGMTISAVFVAGNGIPVDTGTGTGTGTGSAHRPSEPAATPPSPATTSTIVITTGNGVVTRIPVKPIVIDPCG